jgi:signal transduction histidine kinase
MLDRYLEEHRAELVARCRAKVLARTQPGSTAGELDHGVTPFLARLIGTLQLEQGSRSSLDYADLCEVIAEYACQHGALQADRQADAYNLRLGQFAHELRNHLGTATLAVMALKTGRVGVASATGAVLDRSLVNLRNLIDRSLAEVRINSGAILQQQLFSLADFIGDVKAAGDLEASVRGCRLVVAEVDAQLAVDGDRDLLFSAVGNLLQNAFKFTCPGGEVTVRAYAAADRVVIDVGDECGGLPAGDTEAVFAPYAQAGGDRSGLGLGLSISRRSVEANHGRLAARDIPGHGCVFSIELPRHAIAA